MTFHSSLLNDMNVFIFPVRRWSNSFLAFYKLYILDIR